MLYMYNMMVVICIDGDVHRCYGCQDWPPGIVILVTTDVTVIYCCVRSVASILATTLRHECARSDDDAAPKQSRQQVQNDFQAVESGGAILVLSCRVIRCDCFLCQL